MFIALAPDENNIGSAFVIYGAIPRCPDNRGFLLLVLPSSGPIHMRHFHTQYFYFAIKR